MREVSALSLSLEESGMKNGIVVADKGFASEGNFTVISCLKDIESAEIKYVVPLKRNSSEIDYTVFKSGSKSAFEGRPIWYLSNGGIHSFLDPDLKADEERSYLSAVERKTEGYTIQQFHEKQHVFGSVTLKSNAGKLPKKHSCCTNNAVKSSNHLTF